MNFTIDSTSGWSLKFYNQLPEKYTGPRLPGGEILSANGEFGNLCIQEFDGGSFTIRYAVIETKHPLDLNARSLQSGLHATIILKSNQNSRVTIGEQVMMQERQFAIFQAHQPTSTINLLGQQNFISFEAFLSPDLAASVAEDFPELSNILLPATSESPAILMKPDIYIDNEVSDHIHYILTYSDPVKWRRNYFENRVWDITWKLLALYLDKANSEENIAVNDAEMANAIQRLILDHLDQHVLISELSKKVGANDSRIKKIFKLVYGMGIHQYRIFARLKLAIRLLDEGMSVKQAAAATGWRPADLIKAYYKVYGTTPGTIKKRK